MPNKIVLLLVKNIHMSHYLLILWVNFYFNAMMLQFQDG